MCVRAHVYVYVCVYVYVYVCVRVHACVCVCVRVRVRAYGGSSPGGSRSSLSQVNMSTAYFRMTEKML